MVLALAFASVVFLTAPAQRLNRLLALLLFVDALDVFSSGAGAMRMADRASEAYAWAIAHFVVDVWVIAAYLSFIGAALDSPLTRPLRGRAARVGVVGAAGVACAAILAFPGAMMRSVSPGGGGGFPWDFALGPSTWLLWSAMAAVYTYGLVAAIDARRRARSAAARRRGSFYLLGIGVRDAGWAVAFSFLALTGLGTLSTATASALDIVFTLVYVGTLALYVPLLAYGILSTQLFDIDLRLKWTVRRGTVVAAFVAVFFVVATVAGEFLTGTYGYLAGGVAAGLLFLVLAPIQRAAERVADRALPSVRDTAEYRTVRKREVYRAALEGALQDGVVTDKERDILARLQDQLGLSATEARALERQVSAR